LQIGKTAKAHFVRATLPRLTAAVAADLAALLLQQKLCWFHWKVFQCFRILFITLELYFKIKYKLELKSLRNNK